MGNKSSRDIELAKKQVALTSKLPELHWGPVVDGASMTGTPQQLIAAGKFNNRVPVLIGSNRDEFSVLINMINLSTYLPWMGETHFDQMLAYLGKENIERVKAVYDPTVYEYPKHLGRFSQWWWTAMRVATDNGIPFHGFPKGVALGHCSARRIAEQFARGGTPAVYLYNFARDILGGQVGHGFEIPFVFHQMPIGLGHGNTDLSNAMVNYWTNFAFSGNPSPCGANNNSIQWPSYAPDGSMANIKFDATFSAANITVEYAFRKQACDFWDKLANADSLTSNEVLV